MMMRTPRLVVSQITSILAAEVDLRRAQITIQPATHLISRIMPTMMPTQTKILLFAPGENRSLTTRESNRNW